MSNLSKTNINRLIVVDSRVTDWKSLIGDDNQNTTLLVLDSARDGLTQLAEAVVNSSNLNSIHILSHGSSGSLLLGSTTLNNSNLKDYQTQLVIISNALSTDGDILLYGCNVAQGEQGLNFINQLSALTGADVAASTDLTGAANQGGDWVLEAASGQIETTLVVNEAAQVQYTGTLLANTAAINGGIIITSLGSSFASGQSVTVQADGKIIVAGLCVDALYDFALTRYNSDGSLDTSFDADGKVTTDMSLNYDYGYSVTVQVDGKILVAGYSNNGTNGSTDNDFALTRYNSDGSLDLSFDTDGKATTAMGSLSDDRSYSVTVQADGKILVAGASYNGSNWAFALTRYNSNGSLDLSFDTDGKVTTSVGLSADEGSSVTVQADGKILVAGSSHNGSNWDFALIRYNGDGSLDTSFDTDGKVTTDVGLYDDYGQSVSVQADGKILVAGYSWGSLYTNTKFALTRYNSDGSLDTSFDADGKVTTQVGLSYDYGYSVTVQADGKVLVAGDSYNGNYVDFALTRYNGDGSLDLSFDGDGKVTTAVGLSDDWGRSVTVQADGKILVAGSSYNNSSNWADFALIRYNTDGSLDNSFDGGTPPILPTASELFNLVLMPEEKSVAGAEQAGMIRTMADFSKAAYHIAHPGLIENNVINDFSLNAHDALNSLNDQGWKPLNLHPTLPAATSVISGQTITNGMCDDGFYIYGNAAACVAHCEDAIVLSFRGTNDNAEDNSNDLGNIVHPDADQWGAVFDRSSADMMDYYVLLQPLIDAFDAYILEHGIHKVYVTGHSLGGAMALQYMNNHEGTQYQAVTFAAPAFTSSNGWREDFIDQSNIIQIEIAGDPVPQTWDVLKDQNRPGNVIDFAGDQTLNTPDRHFTINGNDNNHSMDYYRQITDSVDADSWTRILAATRGASTEVQTVLLGGRTQGTHFIVDGQLSGDNIDIDNGNNTLSAIDYRHDINRRVMEDPNVIYGGKGDDTLVALSIDTLLLGGIGNDKLQGGTGDDTLIGGKGDDTLIGGKGNDIINGGAGADSLSGGIGKDSYDLIETIPTTDTLHIATSDSLVRSYDKVSGFKLGTGIGTTGVDKLDLDNTRIAVNANTVNGKDSGIIHSHHISNGIINFDDINNYTQPLNIITQTDLADVFNYLEANIKGQNTVAFVSGENTYVFQDGQPGDTLVELVGVTVHSVSTTGLATDSVWIV